MSKKQKIDQFFQSKGKKSADKEEQEEQQEEQKDAQLQQVKGAIPPFDDFINGLDTWKPALNSFINSQKMKGIYNFIQKEYNAKKCYPPPNLIFNAFKTTPINQIKVVVVGQDPYINENEAMGLCFSVPKGTKIPPSLANIYKCLTTDIPGFQAPKHGDLTKWAQQGVFLLNTVLTVEAGLSNSHKNCGWTDFTDEVIKVIDKECKGIVFLLWGKPAQAKAKKVDRNKHFILETVHPSPLSARGGFFECGKDIEVIQ